MTITVSIPAMLAVSIGSRSIEIDADTLANALTALAKHPRLGPLVFDDAGDVRPHVLVFHNDTATRHLSMLDVPLMTGDRIAIVQAVSGG